MNAQRRTASTAALRSAAAIPPAYGPLDVFVGRTPASVSVTVSGSVLQVAA